MKKVKSKKFVGYVPKGESLKETVKSIIYTLEKDFDKSYRNFNMYSSVKEFNETQIGKPVKRTITISWHDEEVK